jgi:iron complex outermembrane recepter protein
MRSLIFTLALLAAPALSGRVAAQSSVDLASVNLEDLLKIEVRSVSKKEQQLFRTPAAVYVLTNEEIRRSGATTVPDALRLVPGIQVAQIDGNKWAVSARGFNSMWSNKLLVLVDGRVVYTPVSSGVYWDLQDMLLEDLERIEVIRGPGATVWGANAVNGVINIISKSADATQGGLVAFTTGNVLDAIIGARYGGALGKKGHYRLFAKHSARGEMVDDEGQPAGDDSRMSQLGFRADLQPTAIDSLTVEGGALWGESGQRVNSAMTSYIPAPVTVVKRDSPAHVGNVLARWTREKTARSSVSVQAFWDKSYRLVVGKGEWTQTVDVEFQHRFPLGRRHDLVWGAGQRFWWDREDVKFAEFLDPASSHTRLFNAFVQDEMALSPQFNLTVGSKFEHNSAAGFEVQPTARLSWSPNAEQTVWTSISRASRTPSRLERALNVDFASVFAPDGSIVTFGIRGNPDLQNEHSTSIELGFRSGFGSHLMFDVTTYHTRLDDLATALSATAFVTDPGPPHLLVFRKYMSTTTAESNGVELLARWQPLPTWRFDAMLDFFDTQLQGPGLQHPDVKPMIDRNPEFQWRLKSWFTLPNTWQVDATLSYVAELNSIDVEGYNRLDVRFGGPLRKGLNLSVTGQNLLDKAHREFDGFEGVLFSQARRSGTVKLTVVF